MGYGEDGGGGGGGIDPDAFSATLRRVAERCGSAWGGEGAGAAAGLLESRLGWSSALPARAQHQYALMSQEAADEALAAGGGGARSAAATGQPPAFGG
ncbi:unnamed protein product, partial [Ectocarpus fasciculatus]